MGARGASTEKFMVCGHRLKFRNLHQQFTNPHESFRCAQIFFPLTALACCPADGNSFSSSHSHVSSKQWLNAYWAHVNFTTSFFLGWGGIFLFFFSDLTLFSCSSCVTSKHSNLRVVSVVPQNKRIKNTSNHTYIAQFWDRSLHKVPCFPTQWSLVSQEREKTMTYSAINVYPHLIWAIWSLPISCTHTPNRC